MTFSKVKRGVKGSETPIYGTFSLIYQHDSLVRPQRRDREEEHFELTSVHYVLELFKF